MGEDKMGTNFHTAWITTTKYRATEMEGRLDDLDTAITYVRKPIISCDGTLVFDSSTNTLTWSDIIRIWFVREDGQSILNTIAAGNIVITVGQFIYVTLNETNNTVLTVSQAAISTGATSNFKSNTILVLGVHNTTSDGFFPVHLPELTINAGLISSLGALMTNTLQNYFPGAYERATRPSILGSSTAAQRRTLVLPARHVFIGSLTYLRSTGNYDLDSSANWDDSQYATASNRAGKDFYIYDTTSSTVVLSANTTTPSGYTAAQVRQIGGFHCLCSSVGTIASHTLTDFLTGDILPASIWDLRFRPISSSAGMCYIGALDIWVDIYLQSGTAATTASVFGATITDTRTWLNFVDDLATVNKRLLTDLEFQVSAEGSNQKTNITGSADPVTTGGHTDTAGRRMISNYGLEDCCGALNQWLADQAYQNDATYAGAFGWYVLPDNKGSIYRQGAIGDVKLVAGGYWASGVNCGSQCRNMFNSRSATGSVLSARGCARRRCSSELG